MRRKVEVLERVEPEHDGDALHRVIISELTLPLIIEAGHCIAHAPSPEFLGYRAAGRRYLRGAAEKLVATPTANRSVAGRCLGIVAGESERPFAIH